MNVSKSPLVNSVPVYMCVECEAIYTVMVSQCDCHDGKQEWIEGVATFPLVKPLVDKDSGVSIEKFLSKENKLLRNAGCDLAEAAIRVTKEYDGIHRLMLAVSDWAKAIANEGGRDDLYSKDE